MSSEMEKLFARIIQRATINLRELEFEVKPYVWNLVPPSQMEKFYAFYGITADHPINFHFKHSGLAGSYFLGQCQVINSLLYKSDVRGDELKQKGDVLQFNNFEIEVSKDEEIYIEDSALIKTMVHNYSHDPESLEQFFIKNTVSTHYANIHGAPCDGCFLEPFATIDLTTVHDCVVGAFSYIQAGEINHLNIKPGTIWVRSQGNFDFLYRYPQDQLRKYVYFTAGSRPQGVFIDFMEESKDEFQRVFDTINLEFPVPVPNSSSLDRYAVIDLRTQIGENVLVAQRAFLKNSRLGKGANAQENCFVIHSCLEGNNITAHGAKIIEADLGRDVFVGFNSFLQGKPEGRLTIGKGCIIMPHTIIDSNDPLVIPAGYLVWGLITGQKDLECNSLSIDDFESIENGLEKGNMTFIGCGKSLVTAFRERIHHILEANGALFDGRDKKGHAQKNQDISFNTIQPYPKGALKGLYPTITIQP
jgi:carbonic anhydrase/acetyltransferase-like protein (isoleucine patch superfamily)